MVHGNVRMSSIFTNKAGEWKLGGFELLDSMKEESPMIMVSRIQDVIAVGVFTNNLYTRLLVG